MLMVAIAAQQLAAPSSEVSLATSEAIDIARVAARSWENGHMDPAHVTFDVVDPARDQLAGYTSVIYYQEGHPILNVSINLSTGQVVDRNRCIYFDEPYFRRLRVRFHSATGVPAESYSALATGLGCDALARR
jgi:hypothetical protein